MMICLERAILWRRPTEGSYFGECILLGEHLSSFSVIAVGNVVCSILTKENFDSVCGPLPRLSQADMSRPYSTYQSSESIRDLDTSDMKKIQIIDLEWNTCLYSTDVSEIGLVRVKDCEKLLSLKRFSKQKVKKLGKEGLVLKEKNILKFMSHSPFIPRVLCTVADQTHAAILLDTCIACSVTSVIHNRLNENSAKFCAASIVIALEVLHENEFLYRGVSPEVLAFHPTGYIQVPLVSECVDPWRFLLADIYDPPVICILKLIIKRVFRCNWFCGKHSRQF